MPKKSPLVPRKRLRGFMKMAGAELVSPAAVDRLNDVLAGRAAKLLACSAEFARHGGRKTIQLGDASLCLDQARWP